MGNIKRAAIKRCSRITGIVNGVAFGMFGIGVFFRALMAAFDCVIDTARETVVANSPDFFFGSDDNRTNLRAAIL